MEDKDSHLGGFIEGGDPATFFPHLWHWLVADEQGPKMRSVLDIGCGEGQSLKFFRDVLHMDALGVDGVQQNDPDIMTFDFSRQQWNFNKEFDMVWCCEFLEHLDERSLPNVIPALTSAKYIFITHAFPGQLGTHHVNCRWPDYWIGFFAGLEYTLEHELTAKCRDISRANTSRWNHFERSGLVFRRL